MFRSVTRVRVHPTVAIIFEGQRKTVPAGITVMASVLAEDAKFTRTTAISGCKRTAYCQMGVCFECLMEIDGIPNQQACMINVREGMTIRRQSGARELEK